MTRWGLVLLWPVVLCACGGDAPSRRAAPRGTDVPADAPGFRFVAATPVGLDVAQETGGADVDYIIDSIGAGAGWLDYDGDGDADLYLAQGATPDAPQNGPPDRLLRNEGVADGDGMPRFVDVTTAAGLGDRLWSFGVAVADVEGDGDPDIYVTNWGANRLYLNDGHGVFTEIAAAAGVADPRWSVSAAWADPDRDGDLDLYVTNYVAFDFARYPARGERLAGGRPPCVWRGIEVYCGPRNLEPAPDAFYRNEGDPDGDGIPRFVEATREVGLAVDPPLFALAALFVDGDDDGDDDLYVANDSVRNSWFLNRGDGTFEEAAILAGLAYNEQGDEQAGMGIAAGDYDGDGRIDLAVTNFSHDHDTLYHNDGDGLFSDRSYAAGLGASTFFGLAWGVSFVDLDQDGWEDLLVARGHVYPQVDTREIGTSFRQRAGLYRNRGDGTFEDVADRGGPGLADARNHRVLLPIDLDDDGDLDALVTRLDATPVVLRNDGATGHWLQVKLAGRRPNVDGIGARLRLRAGGREQRRQITRSASFAGSVLPVAHFGLGPSRQVARLEIVWPSGDTTVLEDLAVDRMIVVDEPADR